MILISKIHNPDKNEFHFINQLFPTQKKECFQFWKTAILIFSRDKTIIPESDEFFLWNFVFEKQMDDFNFKSLYCSPFIYLFIWTKKKTIFFKCHKFHELYKLF